jgi:hypothetical protein
MQSGIRIAPTLRHRLRRPRGNRPRPQSDPASPRIEALQKAAAVQLAPQAKRAGVGRADALAVLAQPTDLQRSATGSDNDLRVLEFECG